jgi:hypothetical protein
MLRNHFGHTRWYSEVMRLKWKLDLAGLEIVPILTQDRCMVWPNILEAQKSFCRHRMELYVRWVMWNLILVCLEILLLSEQDRCTVCAKHTIGSEIVLDAPDGTPR